MNTKISDNDNIKEFPNKLKLENNNAFCKDGFCVMPNQNKNLMHKEQKDKNFFDPI